MSSVLKQCVRPDVARARLPVTRGVVMGVSAVFDGTGELAIQMAS